MKNYKFTINGNQYEVEVKSFEENIAEIEVNGTSYTVELQKEIKAPKTPKLVRAKVSPSNESKPLTRSGTLSTIKAPLPGSILQVFVKEGDAVEKESKLMILEAMKMENTILSEKSGLVKSVKVTPGSTVLQGDVLVEIE